MILERDVVGVRAGHSGGQLENIGPAARSWDDAMQNHMNRNDGSPGLPALASGLPLILSHAGCC